MEMNVIDLQYFKDRVSEFPLHGISSAKLESIKIAELISALEDAKEIMEQQVGVDGCIQVSMDPIRNWLAKYFQASGG